MSLGYICIYVIFRTATSIPGAYFINITIIVIIGNFSEYLGLIDRDDFGISETSPLASVDPDSDEGMKGTREITG